MMSLGKMLILIGIAAVVIGAAIMLSSKITWIGRLPGDILIKKENFTFYFPITTGIIVSIILSVILHIFSKK